MVTMVGRGGHRGEVPDPTVGPALAQGRAWTVTVTVTMEDGTTVAEHQIVLTILTVLPAWR